MQLVRWFKTHCSWIFLVNKEIQKWPVNFSTHEKTVVNVNFCSSSPVEGPGTIVGDMAGEFGDEIPELAKRISACTKCSGYVSLSCDIIQHYFQHRNIPYRVHYLWQMQLICLSTVDVCDFLILLLHFLKDLCQFILEQLFL